LTAISLEEITESPKHRLVGDELLCRVWSNTRLNIIWLNCIVMRGTSRPFVLWLSWNYTSVVTCMRVWAVIAYDTQSVK